MAQIFKAKTLVSSTGRFSYEATAPNLVYNTGDQTISGNKNFTQNVIVGDQSQQDLFVVSGNNISFGVYPTINGTGIVYTQGDQNISGIKTFASRPTVNGTNVLLSGDAIISGDLTGYLPYPTVNKLQGYKLDLGAAPADGQILQWDNTSSSWKAGAIPAGGNGGGGLVYYFNFLNQSGILPTGGLPTSGLTSLSLLGRDYSVGSGSYTTPDLDPENSYLLINHFVTASGTPGVTNIPAGLWDFNIWANTSSASATQTAMKAVVNIYNPLTSGYRFLGQSDDIYLYDTTTIAQYLLNVTVPQTGIQSYERIYIQLFGKKTTNPARTITIYFDSYRPTHVHTTIPSIAGDGVVKVINGVFQTPATGIFDTDVDNNANIQQSKILNLSSDLNDIRSTGIALNNKINSLSGTLTSDYLTISSASSTYATITNLGITGSTLATNLANTGSTLATNLASTGSTLQTNINNLSGYINSSSSNIVFTTGNQNIGGNKTFTGVTTFSGQEVNLVDIALNLSGVGDMTFSGTNINFINSPVFISGTDLRVSGNVYAIGASFTTRPTVNGTGVLLSGEAASLPTTIVYTTGNQTINGLKTFTSGIDIYSGTSPQSLRIFNSTGTNSGEFALIGWQPNLGIVSTTTNALVIGTQSSNSGILRDVIITGENIALSPRSGRLYINGTSSLNDHLLFTSPCSGNITGYITGIGFTGNYTGNYEGGYFLGRTRLTQNTVQLVDSSFGSNYVRKSTNAPSQAFRSLAVSSDGRYQITAVGDYGITAGYVYVSNDYGNTWTPRITDATRSWRGVAISADGKYQTACHNNGYIYISNDYGNTWTAKDSVRYWATVAMSSDGKYQTATGGNLPTNAVGIYISNDYGNTWTLKQSSSFYVSITMSSDGKYQYAVENSSGNGNIYRSSDYGNTWTILTGGASTSYTSIATSADGRFIIVGRQGNTLLISNNYGATLVAKSISANYFSVAVSDNGKYMVAGIGAYFVTTGGIYFSSDYGNTWRLITPASAVWAVAMSSNAKYVLGVNSANSTTPVHIFKTDELIDGNLTINNNLTLPSGDFYSYNVSGVNSGEFGLIGWRNNRFVIGSQQSQNGILRDVVITGNNININGSGVLNIFNNTNITGNLTVSGNTTITGHLSAASKSFLIDHPTQIGKKLQYGSLEGPEHGVFVRGKTNDNIINLPNYWPALVDENSISVNLTPISAANNIYVIDYNNTRIITSGNNRNDYFYTVYGERKDIPKLTVEF